MTKITSVYRIQEHKDGRQAAAAAAAAGASNDDGTYSSSSSTSSSSTSCMPGFEFERRQLPMAVSADRKITMVIDLRPRGLSYDHNILRARELDEFAAKYHILSADERRASLTCTRAQFVAILSQSVPCVGCRRSVERLYDQLQSSGHPTLEPVQITGDGVLTVVPTDMAKPPVVAALLHKHQPLLTALLENQPRNKKSSRCTLHSLDSFRSRPFSEMWREVWGCMKTECREEVTQINTSDLHRTLDAYLKKHKFCAECRTKVEKAYGLLLSDRNPNKEKGYVAGLYANIKKCVPNKHIHLRTKTEFIDSLIRRAEPELNGSHTRHRERHAKTLEIAQEEVLTCIGMFIYERLRRVHLCLKEEENAVQVLAAVAAHALCRSFDTAVEQKRGISNLELLYQEISRAERAKKQRQELKKLKKKQKKVGERQQQLEEEEEQNQQLERSKGADDDDEDAEEDSCAEVCQCESDCTCETNADEIGYDTEEQDTSSVCCSESNDVAGEEKSAQADDESCCTNASDAVPLAASDEALCTCSSISSGSPTATKKSKGKAQQQQQHGNSPISNGRATTATVDAGYGSETLSVPSSRVSSSNSSPDGSEVACSEGFCNHEVSTVRESNGNATDARPTGTPKHQQRQQQQHRHSHNHHQHEHQHHHHHHESATIGKPQDAPMLTLQQMLDDSTESDDDHAGSTIPDAVLLDYADRQQKIKALREQLRQDLRHRFAAICVKTTPAASGTAA